MMTILLGVMISVLQHLWRGEEISTVRITIMKRQHSQGGYFACENNCHEASSSIHGEDILSHDDFHRSTKTVE